MQSLAKSLWCENRKVSTSIKLCFSKTGNMQASWTERGRETAVAVWEDRLVSQQERNWSIQVQGPHHGRCREQGRRDNPWLWYWLHSMLWTKLPMWKNLPILHIGKLACVSKCACTYTVQCAHVASHMWWFKMEIWHGLVCLSVAQCTYMCWSYAY